MTVIQAERSIFGCCSPKGRKKDVVTQKLKSTSTQVQPKLELCRSESRTTTVPVRGEEQHGTKMQTGQVSTEGKDLGCKSQFLCCCKVSSPGHNSIQSLTVSSTFHVSKMCGCISNGRCSHQRVPRELALALKGEPICMHEGSGNSCRSLGAIFDEEPR